MQFYYAEYFFNEKINEEARWHIGMSSASHQEDLGSNLSNGKLFS